jgi:hypothetical protein
VAVDQGLVQDARREPRLPDPGVPDEQRLKPAEMKSRPARSLMAGADTLGTLRSRSVG